ncbi:uncharacterized protein LOC119402179 [Rhipicephalus sanguineus]|uniref:uncharacterized protein LOC119402179 n=1 Tax=Rhipicephalus sanguineus TaxID=34632 RepID=UPI0020C3CCF4|nr:uncharacterized protein LOC119402179 [Rhipicephalus sanguineus]
MRLARQCILCVLALYALLTALGQLPSCVLAEKHGGEVTYADLDLDKTRGRTPVPPRGDQTIYTSIRKNSSRRIKRSEAFRRPRSPPRGNKAPRPPPRTTSLSNASKPIRTPRRHRSPYQGR